MVRILFGDIINGRLDRATYLAYSGLLLVFVLMFIFYLMSGIVVDFSDFEAAQQKIIDLSANMPPDILAMAAFIKFVKVNLVLKRLRDTGLIVGLTLTTLFMVYAMTPLPLFLGLLELSMLVLMVIPTDIFRQESLA